jgi:hypothetical protein
MHEVYVFSDENIESTTLVPAVVPVTYRMSMRQKRKEDRNVHKTRDGYISL